MGVKEQLIDYFGAVEQTVVSKALLHEVAGVIESYVTDYKRWFHWIRSKQCFIVRKKTLE